MKRQIKCKFEELDEVLENSIMEYDTKAYIVDLQDCDDKIYVLGYRILFPSVNYSMRSGLYLCKYENEDDLVGDFSLSLVYDYDEDDPAQWIYWEQDGEIVSLYNFLNIIDEHGLFHGLTDSECIVELELVEE